MKNPEIAEMVKIARKAGWQEKAKGSAHLMLISPEGRTVTLSSKGGDPRMAKNVRASLRRAGLDL